tara:strand:- start:1846 stop:2199 length:354 start_codon:yes stop_codon:yes gene_type:complete
MIRIGTEESKFIYFDVDETLIRWHPIESEIIIDGHAMGINWNVIKYMRKCKANGMTVVVWSQGGCEWAEEVVKVLNIESMVDVCLSKPSIYVDDLGQFAWMGEWVKVNNKGELSSGF